MPSGKGQPSPAPSKRLNVPRTVEAAMPSRRAISRVEIPAENFKRMISRTWRIATLSAALFRVPPWAIQGSDDSSVKRCDAPGARDHSFEVFRRYVNARNRASAGPSRLDGARDVEAFRGRRAGLALAGRHERRRPGGGALRQSRDQTGPSPPRRAGLADGSSGAEAQARHPGDRLG